MNTQMYPVEAISNLTPRGPGWAALEGTRREFPDWLLAKIAQVYKQPVAYTHRIRRAMNLCNKSRAHDHQP
jgi:hypothetical protein